jgi:hypothetical protein
MGPKETLPLLSGRLQQRVASGRSWRSHRREEYKRILAVPGDEQEVVGDADLHRPAAGVLMLLGSTTATPFFYTLF